MGTSYASYNKDFNMMVVDSTGLRESPAFGQPATLYAPKTRGAQQYRALAEELVNEELVNHERKTH